jgi:hypothetical protein
MGEMVVTVDNRDMKEVYHLLSKGAEGEGEEEEEEDIRTNTHKSSSC